MALTQVSTGGIKDGQVHTADLADAQITAGKLHADALDRTYTLGADGHNHYTFTGEGLTGAVNDPTLYLTRGKTYRFVNGNSSGAHPFRIQTTVNGSAGTEYNTGVTNNGGAGGSTIVFEVPHDAPDVLYYQCTSHGAMGGIFYITGALADGGVTTAKIADSGVTTPKIADLNITTGKIGDFQVTGTKIAIDSIDSGHYIDGSIDTAHIADAQITTAKLADNAVTEAKINNLAVSTAKLANNAVTTVKIFDANITTDKIAANAVTTAKIADRAVDLSKLPHGTSSNDGKFLRANNGADPSFETIPTPSSFVTGMIIMWNSTVASIPSGWVLCDGNNSTPDLRDKFIVGAKQDDSGTAKTNVSGSLTQTGGSATDSVTSTGNWYGATRIGTYGTNDSAKQLSIGATTTPYAHSGNRFQLLTGYRYDISTLTLNNIEVSGTVDTLTPYYALCFIMKT